MKCKSCGAPLKKGQLNCAYCGATVSSESLKRFNKEIDKIDHDTHSLNTLPNRIAEIISRKVFKGLFITILIILSILILLPTIQTAFTMASNHKSNHQKDTLEAFFQSKDYQGLIRYYEKIDRPHDKKFTKYEEIYSLERTANYMRTHMSQFSDGTNKFSKKSAIDWGLYYCIKVIDMANESINDSAILGNESMLSTYIDEAHDYCINDFNLTTNEVDQLTAIAISGNYDVDDDTNDELTKIILERISQ